MSIPLSDHSSGIVDHPLENFLHVLIGGREEKNQTVHITDPEKVDTALKLMLHSVWLFWAEASQKSYCTVAGCDAFLLH